MSDAELSRRNLLQSLAALAVPVSNVECIGAEPKIAAFVLTTDLHVTEQHNAAISAHWKSSMKGTPHENTPVVVLPGSIKVQAVAEIPPGAE